MMVSRTSPESLLHPRERMIAEQLVGRGISDQRVLAAMRQVARAAFLSEEQAASAYEDGPLPIGGGQTISQPYIVARMAEAARIAPSDRIMEVGAGCGYASAVLAHLGTSVTGIERDADLARMAAATIARLGIRTVEIIEGDGTQGCPARAPFDVIIISAAARTLPEALPTQLSLGGRLVAPLGGPDDIQVLTRTMRTGPSTFDQTKLEPVRFVPLVPGMRRRGE